MTKARPTLCVECGPGVQIDEDGCCVTCGGGATGSWLDKAVCVVCKVRMRALNRFNGKPLSFCDNPDCAVTAMERLDKAGVIPDEMAARLKLRALTAREHEFIGDGLDCEACGEGCQYYLHTDRDPIQ